VNKNESKKTVKVLSPLIWYLRPNQEALALMNILVVNRWKIRFVYLKGFFIVVFAMKNASFFSPFKCLNFRYHYWFINFSIVKWSNITKQKIYLAQMRSALISRLQILCTYGMCKISIDLIILFDYIELFTCIWEISVFKMYRIEEVLNNWSIE